MIHFKDDKNNPFSFEKDIEDAVLNLYKEKFNLTQITGSEFENLIAPSLNDLKTFKINQINEACEQTIISGFSCSTLGSEHTYQSDRDDQSNLLGLNLANKDTLLKCHDGNAWDYKPHTASQIKDVFDAGVTHKETNLLKAHQLKVQVQSATSAEEIKGINW